MPKTLVTVDHHPLAGYRLTFPFDRRVVDGIKATVPSARRHYDPQTHVWTLFEPQDVEALRFRCRPFADFERTDHRKVG